MLVEGQADATTFGKWGIPAIALGGMKVSDVLLRSLKAYKRVFVALDNTDKASAKSREIALALAVGVSCVATNNMHCAMPDERQLQDVLVCIRHNTTLDECTHLHPNAEYTLKSRAGWVRFGTTRII